MAGIYMEKKLEEVQHSVFPSGYTIRPLVRGQQEQLWCDLTNKCFAVDSGQCGVTVEMFMEELRQKDYIEGGVMLLWLRETPIGAIRVSRNCDERGEAAFITYVSILEEYRNNGLGRMLLRKALEFAKEQGFKRAALSVSAENPGATRLYLGEGFEKLDTTHAI